MMASPGVLGIHRGCIERHVKSIRDGCYKHPDFICESDRLMFVGAQGNQSIEWSKLRAHTQNIDKHVLKLLDLRQLMLDVQEECEKAIVQLRLAGRTEFPTFDPKGGICVRTAGMDCVKIPGGVDLDGNKRYMAGDYVYPDANYVVIPAVF